MIEVLTDPSPLDAEDLNGLMLYINPDFKGRDADGWQAIVKQSGVTIVIYRDRERRIRGTGMVIIAEASSRKKAYFEDLAVDESARRYGIATKIILERLAIAARASAPVAYLTSSRPDAQRLLKKLGFQIYETMVFQRSTS